jgi:hypothetical protein
MISFTFTYRKGLIPWLIRWFSQGKWSHVIIGVDGYYFEAIGGRLFGVNGCVMAPSKFSYHQGKFKPTDSTTLIIESNGTEPEVAEFLISEVGRQYDYLGFLSFAFRWVSGKSKAYYCSELALKAFGIAQGVDYQQKYTPDELYELVLNR